MSNINNIVISDVPPISPNTLWLKYITNQGVYVPKILGPNGWTGIKAEEVKNEHDIFYLNSQDSPFKVTESWDNINTAIKEGKALYIYGSNQLLPILYVDDECIMYAILNNKQYVSYFYITKTNNTPIEIRTLSINDIDDTQGLLYTKNYINNKFNEINSNLNKSTSTFKVGEAIFRDASSSELLEAIGGSWTDLINKISNGVLITASIDSQITMCSLCSKCLDSNNIELIFIDSSGSKDMSFYKINLANNDGVLYNSSYSITFSGSLLG